MGWKELDVLIVTAVFCLKGSPAIGMGAKRLAVALVVAVAFCCKGLYVIGIRVKGDVFPF